MAMHQAPDGNLETVTAGQAQGLAEVQATPPSPWLGQPFCSMHSAEAPRSGQGATWLLSLGSFVPPSASRVFGVLPQGAMCAHSGEQMSLRRVSVAQHWELLLQEQGFQPMRPPGLYQQPPNLSFPSLVTCHIVSAHLPESPIPGTLL